ncbi:transposase [Arthrobacter echini]|uniref:Transposase n=2 Tax=Arthrobacter echini TaxID=1529066 RepID=A0A4S5E2J2_9MICC|nr:TniQ family protein [Arthrobacter echini]THJ65614.1 transposase [Arthrobacter echini]TYC96831.1 TniQ family protein [Arthrobacter echini]
MKPTHWPLHPAPVQAEALSSWLRRLASAYGMEASELLAHGLGHGNLQDQELDHNPPATLLTELSRRSGVSRDRVAVMSMIGWTPWLFDSMNPDPEAYRAYVHQFSVLLPHRRRKLHDPAQWLPWLPKHRIHKACRECLTSTEPVALVLFWQLPLMLSCPSHRRRLETYAGQAPEYRRWTFVAAAPSQVSDSVALMDQRTWQAITTGSVNLPRRRVHAGIWFRLLRTLLDELSAVEAQCGRRQLEEIRLLWEHCGYPFRAGLLLWRPFESLPWSIQQQLLEAAALAMEHIETGTLTASGTLAHLLSPEPDRRINDGTPPRPSGRQPARKQASAPAVRALDDLWKQAVDAQEAAVNAARGNSASAQQLYNFALYGRRTERSVRRLQDDFVQLQIPTDFLSDTNKGCADEY